MCRLQKRLRLGSKWNQAINVPFWSRSRDQDEFWVTNTNWSMHFLRQYEGMATLCPLNSRKIKRSRASEWSDQAIKDDFHWSRFLIAVTNTSTGDAYVTTPWGTNYTTCNLKVIIAAGVTHSHRQSATLCPAFHECSFPIVGLSVRGVMETHICHYDRVRKI